jgi:RNA polymerase sigma-70 factor (ECF subfamily)
MDDREFRNDLIGCIPPLRAFAISLTGKMDRADDLVQETLLKAWANRQSFEPGTRLKAWLFTILRNEFYTVFRKRKREVEDANGTIAGNVSVHPEQHGHMDLTDMQTALGKLPVDQREALLLVSASDLSYEEAAVICGVAVGTIKSRVNRARVRLGELLHLKEPSQLGPEAAARSGLISKANA